MAYTLLKQDSHSTAASCWRSCTKSARGSKVRAAVRMARLESQHSRAMPEKKVFYSLKGKLHNIWNQQSLQTTIIIKYKFGCKMLSYMTYISILHDWQNRWLSKSAILTLINCAWKVFMNYAWLSFCLCSNWHVNVYSNCHAMDIG